MNVTWLWLNEEKHNSFWDWAYLEDLFSGKLWRPPGFPEFTHHHGSIPDVKGSIVVIPSRNQVEHLGEINKQLAKLEWALVILTGDEQSVFPWKDLKHPNMKIWAMHPHPDIHQGVDRPLINGYPHQAKQLGKIPQNEKPLDLFFSGQVNHERRVQCVEHAENVPNGKVVRTKGFTQGLPHQEYYQLMSEAKFVPCPSGNHMPDTFRIYEALEAGCIPIADSKPSVDYPGNFWYNLFGGEPPFPIIEEWESLQSVINDWMPQWKQKANEIQSWWQLQKRRSAYDLMSDLHHLAGVDTDPKGVTVMMPSSTIKTHPKTDMINETIGSIRERLPEAEILVQIDGLRKEQAKRLTEYDEYARRLLWETNWKQANVLPIVFREFSHQAIMARKTIDLVKTPYLLYVEHDTPLTDEIDFDDVLKGLDTYKLIRFSHEAVIPKEHDHMMLDKEPRDGFMRTVQWSQRPHITKTDYYRWILSEFFDDKKRAFIEHKMYGKILEEYTFNGYPVWEKYGMVLYAPDPSNLRRSANLNGRANDPVWDSEI